MIDKTGSTDYHAFDRINQEFMAGLRERPELSGLFTFFAANYPQYELIIDNQKAMQKGVSIAKAMENLDLMIGSSFETGFIRFGFFYRAYVQALPQFRALPSDVLKMYVKNEAGEMVPYSSFMTLKKRQGPNELTRYNMYNSSAIRGNNATGYTTGDAVKAIKEWRRRCCRAATTSRGRQLRVSAHFLIRRDGTLVQYVPCAARAWHAGASCWRGRERCNDHSIGIELEGCDAMPFEAAQYATLNDLLTRLRAAHPIEDVVGHSDIAPGRKTDPGPCFDWSRISL